jgi:CheY-like chemotaxis protein
MDWNEDDVRHQLKDWRILVIEDDSDLAPRIEHLFVTYGAAAIVIKRCVVGPKEGGLDALRESGRKFDLVIVDIMLPREEDALQRCDDLQKKWNDLQKEAAELRHKKDSQRRLSDLRKELQWLSETIRKEIDDKAGVKMIEQWCTTPQDRSVEDVIPQVPILFLTARQPESFGQAELQQTTKHARWITKPALDWHVLTTAAELIAEFGKRKGAVPSG